MATKKRIDQQLKLVDLENEITLSEEFGIKNDSFHISSVNEVIDD